MKKLLLALLVVSFNSYASEEADALCELHKAKAELSSSLLSSPYVYGSSNENSTATIAMGYSIAGRSKGQLAKEIAEAKCAAVINTSSLDEIQRWTMVSIHKAGARAEVTQLLQAREIARQHTDLVEKQLRAQTATLTEYNSSRQVLLAIENKINSLRMILAEPSMPVDTLNIKDLLNKARSSEGQVAELVAKQEAQSAWDVVLAAGAQKDLLYANSTVEPFVGLTFKWSFGNYGVKESVSNIRNKTENAFGVSQSGYVKSAERLAAKINELLVAEKEREALLVDTIADVQRITETFKDINTALAISTRKALEVQSLVYTAELAGVRARIERYVKN